MVLEQEVNGLEQERVECEGLTSLSRKASL
jgi:hypothetical protein